jgi:hypothetical protein
MAAATLDIVDFTSEGIRAIEFYFPGPPADVRLAGFNLSEAQIEPLLVSSALVRKQALPAARVESKRRWLRFPWEKAPSIYQVTPLVTVVLATTALVFPRIVGASEPRGVSQTPIYHFNRPEHREAPWVPDDTVTAEQIRALDQLLALPIGVEEDVHIDDWA